MSQSKNGRVTLSAVDFLKLSETKRVARVDLADIRLDGVVYVCDLSAAKQQQLFGGQKSLRVYRDQSRDIELPKDAAAKLMKACMVSDGQDGEIFEAAFDATDEEHIMIDEDKLVYFRDIWKAELGTTRAVDEMIQNMSNIITNHVTKAINQLSGLGDDEPVEEKKSS